MKTKIFVSTKAQLPEAEKLLGGDSNSILVNKKRLQIIDNAFEKHLHKKTNN